MTPDPPGLDTRLAKALSHPLRKRLLMAYTSREASPSQVADELAAPLGDVSYHTKRLHDYGCLELVRAVRGRGGVKHFYRAVVHYEVGDPEWSMLSPALRRTVADPVVAQILADMTAADQTGALGAQDIHVSRTRLDLDAPAWEELTKLLLSVVEQAQRLNRESAARRGGRPGDRPSTLGLLHVPSAPA